jgi:hypothetical protein
MFRTAKKERKKKALLYNNKNIGKSGPGGFKNHHFEFGIPVVTLVSSVRVRNYQFGL